MEEEGMEGVGEAAAGLVAEAVGAAGWALGWWEAAVKAAAAAHGFRSRCNRSRTCRRRNRCLPPHRRSRRPMHSCTSPHMPTPGVGEAESPVAAESMRVVVAAKGVVMAKGMVNRAR